MKKNVLLILILVIALPSIAQVKIQPQAGLTLSRLTTDDIISKSEVRVGTDLGVSFRIGKRVYFFPGAYWKRWSSDLVVLGPDTLGPANFTLDAQFIQVPARLGINVVNKDLFKLRLNSGPAWTRVVKLESDPNDPATWNTGDFNANIWSWQAGVGIDLWFLTLDMSYDQGISAMFVEGDTENRMLSLEIGVVF